MQRAKQGSNKDKPATTKGLPVASDATQRNEPRRTPESRGDRDDHIGGNNQRQHRQGGLGSH
ncbi:hypothetical protein [Xylophilus sp. GOD-11R]|uniref:hypothetical protein n=1 Tax=Xylophilus sp. GOD-11R TaxID=3089814 RepID=UPI00298D0BE2|nr:hypothetical protein [Xylophilus sp. GOD-11R]WPB56206.1 hypothetical protein R9X41_18985 [Xylophilus sp. GOD-11R]